MSNTEIKHTVPLYRIVGAAAIDMYEDYGAVEEKYYHWGARGLRKLTREVLRTGKRKIVIPINQNTKTGTLPCDFKEESFVGYINERGEKISLVYNGALVDSGNIEQAPCEEQCQRCNQDKAICREMEINEEVVFAFSHEGTPYYKSTVRQMQGNGDVYEEITIPILDLEEGTVSYDIQKNLIAHLDKKKCGCLETTPENIEKIRVCNEEVYCCYFAPSCGCDNRKSGTFNIFPESGLIQLSYDSNITKLYMEYEGFIPKVNGQYVVPEEVFEVLVEWVKWKSIQNRKGISQYEKDRQFQHYQREYENAKIILRRVSLQSLLNRIGIIPKFDINTSVRPSIIPYV